MDLCAACFFFVCLFFFLSSHWSLPQLREITVFTIFQKKKKKLAEDLLQQFISIHSAQTESRLFCPMWILNEHSQFCYFFSFSVYRIGTMNRVNKFMSYFSIIIIFFLFFLCFCCCCILKWKYRKKKLFFNHLHRAFNTQSLFRLGQSNKQKKSNK